MFGSGDQCVELQMWFERYGHEEIEQLTVGPKHKFSET